MRSFFSAQLPTVVFFSQLYFNIIHWRILFREMYILVEIYNYHQYIIYFKYYEYRYFVININQNDKIMIMTKKMLFQHSSIELTLLNM